MEEKNSGFGGGCRGGGDIGRRVYKKKLRKKGKVGEDGFSQAVCVKKFGDEG